VKLVYFELAAAKRPVDKTNLIRKGEEFMNANCRRSAFTLIEVLIVVIIMALLAATIIPQFASTTNDAKKSSLNFNLQTMRSQIEMYKINHNATPPSLLKFSDQMTKATDINGNTTGTNLIYGPYIQGQIPTNPFNNLSTIVAVADQTKDPTGVNGTSGWQYNETTGGFFPNNPEYYQQ
jgi:prepilin-type N-terminal cleavage/methylation domain-containing protein